MLYQHEVNGITSIKDLTVKLIDELKNNGFTLKYPLTVDPTNPKAILETTYNVNPVNDAVPEQNIVAQPWRICIEADSTGTGADEALQAGLRIYMGTKHQLPDTGTVTDEYINSTGDVRKSGELSVGRYPKGSKKMDNMTIPFFSYDGCDTTDPFLSQTISNPASRPISYRIAISNHGVALFVWLEASDQMGDKFSWFCAQHLADPVTGAVKLTSKCPVFCLYSTGGGNVKNDPWLEQLSVPETVTLDYPNIYRFTVRESDVLRPTFPQNACIPCADNAPVINPFQQVSIYENKTFALTMPNGFHTDRYLYKEEMDMIMYTSADVISQWNVTSLNMFTPSVLREYTAMHANQPNNAGLRMLILSKEVAQS